MTKTGQDKSASLQAFVDRAHVQRNEQEQVWLPTPITRLLAPRLKPMPIGSSQCRRCVNAGL